eukprot:250825_1
MSFTQPINTIDTSNNEIYPIDSVTNQPAQTVPSSMSQSESIPAVNANDKDDVDIEMQYTTSSYVPVSPTLLPESAEIPPMLDDDNVQISTIHVPSMDVDSTEDIQDDIKIQLEQVHLPQIDYKDCSYESKEVNPLIELLDNIISNKEYSPHPYVSVQFHNNKLDVSVSKKINTLFSRDIQVTGLKMSDVLDKLHYYNYQIKKNHPSEKVWKVCELPDPLIANYYSFIHIKDLCALLKATKMNCILGRAGADVIVWVCTGTKYCTCILCDKYVNNKNVKPEFANTIKHRKN